MLDSIMKLKTKIIIVFVIAVLIMLNHISPKPFKKVDQVECVNIK